MDKHNEPVYRMLRQGISPSIPSVHPLQVLMDAYETKHAQFKLTGLPRPLLACRRVLQRY